MKRQFPALVTTILLSVNTHAITTPDLKQKNPGIAFTENKGQVHDQNFKPRPDVLYGAMAGNMAVHIKNNGVSYQLYRVDKYKTVEDPKTKQPHQQIDQQTIYRIDLTWLNRNTNFTTSEDEVLPGYNNYYLESCPNGALNVKSYKGITLHNLYNGIDIHYYEKAGELKHDYIVAPHVDYKQIQLRVEGASISVNEDGSLMLTTPLGKVQEGAPLVYQNAKPLVSRWVIRNNVLGFEIENCDPNYELIIDPVTRLWGTYYGGFGDDSGNACATDAGGNVYLAGNTDANTGTVIATAGSHQSTLGGNIDAFLVRFDALGVRQMGTYYGGSGFDFAYDCVIDGSGNVFLYGDTDSNSGTVMATAGSHQPVFEGFLDAFLVKFNAGGVRQWATYYGGNGMESARACAIDGTGNIYLTGTTDTYSGTAIASLGSHQATYGGASDAFLAKFNTNGVRLWGTYYGGMGTEISNCCAVDANGSVYFAGTAEASTGTVVSTPGTHQSGFGGGNYDAILVKFDANGVRLWGTYYGGTGDDDGHACATDASGNVYLGAVTDSNMGTVIATAGSHQSTLGGIFDAFLVKFTAAGVRLWGTYYGGMSVDVVTSVVTDAAGNVYMAGDSDSNNGTSIATAGSYQSVFGGGLDGYVAKFDAAGTRQWGTYYGGPGYEYNYGFAVGAGIYLCGETNFSGGTQIATTGSHQDAFGGGSYDGFLVKFTDCLAPPPMPSAINGPTTVCAGDLVVYSTPHVVGASAYAWSVPAGWLGGSNNNTLMTTAGGSGNLTVVALNNCGSSPSVVLPITVNALPTVTASTERPSMCVGESATLIAGGAFNYTFMPGGVTGTSVIVSPPASLTYTVAGVDGNGCIDTFLLTLGVNTCVGIQPNGLANTSFKLYPNPTSGILNLELNADNEVVILNALGQVVYAATYEAGSHQINLSHMAKGVYVVKVGTAVNARNLKLVKE